MTQFTDDKLVAYADGELSPEEAAEVERALETDPRIREAVEMFRETADLSRRAYDDVLHEPIPDRLISAASGDGVRSAQAAARYDEPPRSRIAGLAMAASVALAVGLGGGFGLFQLLGQSGGDPAGPLLVGTVDESDALHLALESAGTGTLIANGEGGNVMPLTTFVDREGRYCREFQAVTSGADGLSASFGIACRQPAGPWRVEAIGAPAVATAAVPDRFETADGATGDPMQVLIEAMSDSGPISLDEEAALLTNGWR